MRLAILVGRWSDDGPACPSTVWAWRGKTRGRCERVAGGMRTGLLRRRVAVENERESGSSEWVPRSLPPAEVAAVPGPPRARSLPASALSGTSSVSWPVRSVSCSVDYLPKRLTKGSLTPCCDRNAVPRLRRLSLRCRRPFNLQLFLFGPRIRPWTGSALFCPGLLERLRSFTLQHPAPQLPTAPRVFITPSSVITPPPLPHHYQLPYQAFQTGARQGSHRVVHTYTRHLSKNRHRYSEESTTLTRVQWGSDIPLVGDDNTFHILSSLICINFMQFLLRTESHCISNICCTILCTTVLF